MKPTLNDLGKLLKTEKIAPSKTMYGVVVDEIRNAEGTVTSYLVSLGGIENVVECRKFAGANINDVVLVTLMSNGAMVVTGRRDGDGDTINFISSTQDGTASINGACLDAIGNNDQVSVSEQAIAMVGTDTQMTLSNGALTLSYQGKNVLKASMGGDGQNLRTETYTGTVRITEGHSASITIPKGTIEKVMVKRTNNIGLIRMVDHYEIDQNPGRQTYYTYDDSGSSMVVTVHNQNVSDLTSTVVTVVEVTYQVNDGANIFDLGDKSYLTENGIMYAAGFQQTSPTSNAPANSASSRTVKHDIKPCEIDCHALYDIDVVQFKYNEDYLAEDDERQGKDIPGFIAEQVEKVFPIAVDHRFTPMWNSQILIPAMLKLIQEQHEEIEKLKEALDGNL